MTELTEIIAQEVADKVCDLIKDKIQLDQRTESGKESILMTTKEAADHYRVHINTIRAWIKKDLIPSQRISSRWYVIVKLEEL